MFGYISEVIRRLSGRRFIADSDLRQRFPSNSATSLPKESKGIIYNLSINISFIYIIAYYFVSCAKYLNGFKRFKIVSSFINGVMISWFNNCRSRRFEASRIRRFTGIICSFNFSFFLRRHVAKFENLRLILFSLSERRSDYGDYRTA